MRIKYNKFLIFSAIIIFLNFSLFCAYIIAFIYSETISSKAMSGTILRNESKYILSSILYIQNTKNRKEEKIAEFLERNENLRLEKRIEKKDEEMSLFFF